MKMIHVVAGVINNTDGKVLLALRPHHLHQGGLWEFPGGKREAHEAPQQALARELWEELGLKITHARPLIQVSHDYGDTHILLDVWRVTAWHGNPHGREGQQWRWVALADLAHFDFPAANLPVLKALALPSYYAITPEPATIANFFTQAEKLFQKGIRLLQLRSKQLTASDIEQYAKKLYILAQSYEARVVINAEPAYAALVHGLHLDSRNLYQYAQRPLPKTQLLAASCHTEADIAQAQRIDADFIVLSPVRATATHPEATPLGWQRFAELNATCRCPVYALGGMEPQHLALAWAHGAQGIAAIRSLWYAEHVAFNESAGAFHFINA
jgi:8-oxo-dGTP diphosphatase